MNITSWLMSKWPCSTFLLLLASLLVISVTSTRIAHDEREMIKANHGVVATDDGRCSRIGRDVLREGGHAVDAAVAAALCLGVVSPASSGIGGGAFMLIRSADGKTQAFDMRETAPKQASENMYAQNDALKARGVLSIAVPGEIAGLYNAWKQYGKLPWRRLVRPAAHLAHSGFRISPYLHMQMVKSESGIMADKGLRDLFTFDGHLLRKRDICYNKKLGKTLRALSAHGIRPFYNGSIGVNLIKDIRKSGGILTMEDLQQYQVRIREPIVADVMGFKIIGMPPPSSGGAAMVLILNILAQYGYPMKGPSDLIVHRLIEALKHAFAVRMNLGDPDFVKVKNVVNDMLSTEFAKQLKKTIYDNMTFNPNHYGGKWNQIYDHGTSHMSIVDSERNAVSMTTTVNAYFGAKYLSPSTGIVLNNEMDDFSVPTKRSENVPPPAPANFIHPGKRPLSSMTPTIVLKDGQLKAVVGASGGAMIIAGTTEVFLNHFAEGMDPLTSVLVPRYYHQAAISATWLFFSAIPTLLACRRAAESLEKLMDVTREELPDTMAAVRLSGMEISDLTMELSDIGQGLTQGVRSSTRAVRLAEERLRQFSSIPQSATVQGLLVPTETRTAGPALAKKTRDLREGIVKARQVLQMLFALTRYSRTVFNFFKSRAKT